VKIKRLELNGFKSCKDRAVVDFHHAVTGVVGPNGCGKSNVVDALRWVLGEQSAKHLRGQSMEDVIFAGNDRHSPQGMAEVQITFDNEGNLQHIQEDSPEDEPTIASTMRDVPEIQITRRLFRSGESEYEMNGRPCRLRDITELFLGTGVGTKAYSIIEQGRVGQIVGAKPEELRLFIEEAAGTTLYRSRKLAAERKIERTRDNLLRVNDIVGELDRQANSLRRQARGAVRYTELKEQEGEFDRRLSAYKLRHLDGRAAEVQSTLDAVCERDEALRTEMTEATARRDQTRERQRDAERRTEELRKTFYERKGRVSELEQERRYLDSRIEELGRLCGDATTEIATIDEKLGARRGDEARIRDEQEALGRRLEQARISRASEEQAIVQLESGLTKMSGEIESEKARTVETLSREASLTNERGAVTRQREANAGRRAKLREESDSLSMLSEKLVADVEGCTGRLDSLLGDIDSTTGGKESASAKLSNVLSRKAEVERNAESSRTQLAGLSSRFESLQELNDSFEGYGDGVRAFMSNGGRERTGAKAVVADVIEIEQGYERAVAAVLQEQLQYVVVPDADAGVEGASYLREMGTGRASFIPESPRAVPTSAPTDAPSGYSLLSQHVRVGDGFEGLLSNLLDGVVVADSLESATSQWKLNGTYVTFVTRDGEILDAAGVITGGSGTPHDEGLLARKTELRDLEVKVGDAQSNARTAADLHERVGHEAQAVGDDLSRLDQRLHELTVNRVSAEGDIELHRQNLVRTEERSRAVGTEMTALTDEERALSARLDELTRQLDGIATTLRESHEKRKLLEEQYQRCDTTRKEKASRLESLKVEEAELRQKREASEVARQSARSAVEDFESRRAMLANRLDQDGAELATAGERRAAPEMSLDGAREALRTAETEFERVRVSTEQLQDEAASVQKRLDEVGSHLEGLREERSRLELSLKECSLERGNLEEGVRERLGLGADDVLGTVEEQEEDAQALEAELDRVRNGIRRLGTVNVGAVAELEEIEGRLTELSSQRDDLEKSIEDLRGTISRLNRMSRERFKETFDAVNEIFKTTFPRLFSGGKARLELTDEANLLETGVEIFVRPPGKKVGNLNLLSGGEKALTAVSLIFSLFLHKPSPFCVLDEVDAPLDDANIGRFAQMVSDMCDASQFVLITHNKRTMESCDMLYGVTMQEPGVSKIVSVEIAERA